MLVVSPATAGFAQSGAENVQLMNRLNQLENQVQTLSRSVYRGATPPPGALDMGASSSSGSAAAAYEDRISQLEASLRNVTGQVEKINYDVQQMSIRLEKALADNELRFQQLSGGAATSAGAAAGGATGAAAPATSPSFSGSASDAAVTSGNSASGTLGTLSTTAGTGAASADALYESAFADIRESKYDAAEKKFAEFMTKYASHPLAANAQYWLAETYYVRGDYRQSAKMFAQGYQDYPQGQKAADSLLKLGLSLSKLGKKEDACLSLQQLQKQFPGNSSPVNRRAQQELKSLGCS